MFRKTKKIPCYVLVFDQVDIIRKCLQFLAENSGQLEIVVIENPSPNTPQISKIVHDLGSQGLIKAYYLFRENITNNAMLRILNEQIETIRESPFVLVTDGDVTSSDKRWLSEELRILKNNPDVYACGITLDLSNLPLKTFPHAKEWIPADKAEAKDYYENVTGTHLLLTRGSGMAEYLDWVRRTGVESVDSAMHRYCETTLGMKWARTKRAKAYHLTWDLYNDLNHPYTRLRLSKGHKETWQHKHQADYTLKEY